MKIFIKGTPVAKGSVNSYRKGIITYPKKVRDWEKTIREQLPDGLPMYDEPVEVNMIFNLRKPKKPKFDVPATYPDLDKLCRIVDAVKGIWLKDDSRIVKLTAEKCYEEPEGMWIEIREMASNNV